MNRTKLTFLTIAISAAIAVFMTRTATSDENSKVDCSSLKAWNSDTTYKKGDLVVAKSGVTEYNAKFMCKKDKCQGAGNNQPYYDNGAAWQRVGVCK